MADTTAGDLGLERAEALREAGRLPQALAELIRVHARLVAQLGPAHPDTFHARFLTGRTLAELGRAGEAVEVLGPLLARMEAAEGPGATMTVVTRDALAVALDDAGQPDEAIALHRHNLRQSRDVQGRATASGHLALALLARGETDEGLQLFRDAVADLRAAGRDWTSPAVALAGALLDVGLALEAEQTAREAADQREATLGPDAEPTIGALVRVGIALREQRRLTEAAAVFADLAQRAARALGAGHRWSLRIANQAALVASLRSEADAADRWHSLVERAERSLGVTDPEARDFRQNALDNLLALGQVDEALLLLRREADLDLEDPLEEAPGLRYTRALATHGRTEELIAWLEGAVEWAGQDAGLHLRRRLAAAYWEAGRLDDALQGWRELLASWQERDRHGAEALALRLVLADALLQREQWAQAEKVLLAAALSCLRRRDDAAMVAVLGQLVRAGAGAGRWGSVEINTAALVQRLAERDGHDDARTLLARAGHAVALARDGDAARGARLLDELLVICERDHDLHPLDVAVRRARAEVAGLAGDHTAALEWATDAFVDAREIYGDQTRETRAALLGYGLAAEAAGDLESAAAAYHQHRQAAPDGDAPEAELSRMRLHLLGERAPEPSGEPLAGPDELRLPLVTWVRDHGDDAEATLHVRWGLADALRERGRGAEAAEEFAKLQAEHQSAGRHELAVAATNRLAMTVEELGATGEAEQLFAEGLQRAEADLGEDALLAQTLRHNLADTLERRGELDRAAWLFGHNVLSQGRRAGDAHATTIDSRRRLAWTLVLARRMQQALLVARRALTDAEAALQPGAEATLDARNTVALCLEQLGDSDGALQHYEQNLVEAETALGQDSQVVLPYRNNLARSYLEAGRQDEALALYRASAEAVLPEVAAGNLRDAEVLRHLAECLLVQGQPQQAAEWFAAYRDAVQAADGVASERAHRARSAWARSLRSADVDLVALASGADDGTVEGAYAAAALLHWGGDRDAEARLRQRHDLDDPLDEDEGEAATLRRQIGDELAFAAALGPIMAGEGGLDLVRQAAAEARALGQADPGRATAMLALAYSLAQAGETDEALTLCRSELAGIAACGMWGSRARDMYVSFLVVLLANQRRWSERDELLACDARRLEEALGPNDRRTRAAKVLVAAALRRRGLVTAAVELLESLAAGLGVDAHPGDRALVEIAWRRARAAQRLADSLAREPDEGTR